jgi:hypothetical protein
MALVSCTHSRTENYPYDPTATASIAERQLTYAEQRQLLGEQEGGDWARFIDYNGLSNRGNLIGQTVIEGVVTSSASVATYKDLVLHVVFTSKTGTPLSEQDVVIYEFLKPGGSLRLKHKFNTPADAATVQYTITGADYTLR